MATQLILCRQHEAKKSSNCHGDAIKSMSPARGKKKSSKTRNIILISMSPAREKKYIYFFSIFIFQKKKFKFSRGDSINSMSPARGKKAKRLNLKKNKKSLVATQLILCRQHERKKEVKKPEI